LKGAGQEVRALSELFPSGRVYLEDEATPDKLQGVHTPEISFLHLATHGILDSQNPRQSYLVMGQNQRLTVADIAGFQLDSSEGDLSLVTLSACQTAMAEKSGPDGSDLRSLADAFSLAGSRSMLATLWKVDDRATGDFMVAFYRNMKAGKSKAASLQAAQLELLKNPAYRHPFYWAPFVLIGDWR
jgi:CHAT domain-containing protein